MICHKYIFLIGAEHHITEVDAFIKKSNLLPCNIILILQELDERLNFKKKIINKEKYGEIISFINWTSIDLLNFSKKHLKFISICECIKKRFSNVIFLATHYSDDATFLFIRIVQPLKFYLLDEGTASYTVLNERANKQIVLKLKLLIKSIIYGFRLKVPISIIYFSKYNLIHGENDNLELYFSDKQILECDYYLDQFGFLGSSIVELNMILLDDYITYLKNIITFHSYKQLIYFPHRKENVDKLRKIEDLGFQIVNLSEPFENFILTQKKIPFILGSFFTTSVLLNISEKYQNFPRLEIYVFPFSKLKRDVLVYENILEMIQNNSNFNLIHLN